MNDDATTNWPPKPSMNEATRARPLQQQLLRHPRRPRLQAGQPAGAGRDRLQRAHHPRLRGRLRREGPARRPVAGPLAGPRRHRHAARLQQHLPGNPRVHPRELHRLHGLRDRVPRHRHPRQGAVRGRVGGEAADHPRGRPRDVSRRSGRKTKKYYDAGKKKLGAGGMFQIIIDPSQVQGLRRVRHRLRRRRSEDDRRRPTR